MLNCFADGMVFMSYHGVRCCLCFSVLKGLKIALRMGN